MTDAPAYATVPGPVDRESFFDAQTRNRRASWWFTALSAGAILVMGIPLSAVISPLLYALAIVVYDLIHLVVHLPDLFPGGNGSSSSDAVTVAQYAVGAAALILPGSLVLLLSWLGVRRLSRRAGAGGTVLALGAREARNGDYEEQQLVNVVGEMAAAAGVPPPRVRLLDSPVPNAAAVGSRMDDATVVVTTGLLRTLDRDETQGVVAHLVASVGNGDLRIGTTIGSVLQTLGLVSSVLRAPSEGKPRTTLRRLMRYAFHRPGADDAAAAAELLAKAGGDVDSDSMPDANGFKTMLLLPFMVAGLAFSMTSWVFSFVVLNPFLRRAWRSRKYLADAAAVELTRNPDGLARALATLDGRDPLVPGTEWAAHLFVVGRKTAGADAPYTATYVAPVAKRIERLREMGASVPSRLTHRSRRTTVILAVFLTLTSPLWLGFFALLLSLGLLLTMVSLMVDSLFLAPAVALLHALLT